MEVGPGGMVAMTWFRNGFLRIQRPFHPPKIS
jgi:hypothetical protein